jgi:uncharacterized SAM-binding protein YcdF (DUF218 family)
MGQGRIRPRTRSVSVILLILALAGGSGAYLLRGPLLSRMGRALVVADPLEKADAAVVFGRALGPQDQQLHTAARLYRDGWVRKLVLSGPRGPYGIYETEFSFPLAVSLGVPKADILAVPNTTRFIDQEAELLVAVLAGRGLRTVYVVTANYESRRARRIFGRAAGGRLRVLVHPATDDWFNPDTWWQSREGRKVFLMECFGLHTRE